MYIFVIFLVMFTVGIILAIIVNKQLKNSDTIELMLGKLNDDDGDDIEEALKYLKIANRK